MWVRECVSAWFDLLAGLPPYGLALLLVGAFALLAWCADVFVDRGVGIAHRLRVPSLLIGVVLVSLATTLPEVSVSVLSALDGRPGMALGNAVGSVICNTGLALGLCALLSPRPIHVLPSVLRVTGGFLLAAAVLCMLFVVRDLRLTRLEGLVLLALMALYLVRLVGRRPHAIHPPAATDAADREVRGLSRLLLGFAIALVGVLLASRLVLIGAVGLTVAGGIPESVIALTLVALGTSIPEVATCISAARRGQGEIAVGNILGASMLNLTWVIGMAASIHPLVLSRRELWLMFPFLFGIVILTLSVLRSHTVITRREGALLIGAYLLFLGLLKILPLSGMALT